MHENLAAIARLMGASQTATRDIIEALDKYFEKLRAQKTDLEKNLAAPIDHDEKEEADRTARHDDLLNSVIEEEDKLNKFVEHCEKAWASDKSSTSALDDLLQVLTFNADCDFDSSGKARRPEEKKNRKLRQLHIAWETEKMSVPIADSATQGSILLHAKIYSMEEKDVDMFVDGAKGSHAIAPYKVMNAAARIISKSQENNPRHWPTNWKEAEVAFEQWGKSMLTLSAAAVNLQSQDIEESLEHCSKISKATQQQALDSLRGTKDAMRSWLTSAGFSFVGEPPYLYCGLSVEGEKYKEFKEKRKDSLMAFCDLRSTSLCPDVALNFLNYPPPGKIVIVFEGAQRGLPLWNVSKYPWEMEVLLPSCSKFSVESEPKEVKISTSMNALLIHLRWQGMGHNEQFLELVRRYERADSYMLKKLTMIREELDGRSKEQVKSIEMMRQEMEEKIRQEQQQKMEEMEEQIRLEQQKMEEQRSRNKSSEELLLDLMRSLGTQAKALLQSELKDARQIQQAIIMHENLVAIARFMDISQAPTRSIIETLENGIEKLRLHLGEDLATNDDLDRERDGSARHDDLQNSIIESKKKLEGYAELCARFWEESSTSAMDDLLEALKFNAECDFVFGRTARPLEEQKRRRLQALQAAWEKAKPSADNATKGSVLLHAKIYSMQQGDVDQFVGAAQGTTRVAPYKVMNAAARILSGAQQVPESQEEKNGPQPPRPDDHMPHSMDDAKAAFKLWGKSMLTLTAAAVDLKSHETMDSLKNCNLDRDDVDQALHSLQGTKDAMPRWLQKADVSLEGPPYLYCGLSVDDEKYKEFREKRKDSLMAFCDLRSTSLCPGKAINFLSYGEQPGKIMIVFEGAEKGLPLWNASQYRQEMEVLLPCCSRFKVASEPQEVKISNTDTYNTLLIHLRWDGMGLAEQFLGQVRKCETLDSCTLSQLTTIRRQTEEQERRRERAETMTMLQQEALQEMEEKFRREQQQVDNITMMRQHMMKQQEFRETLLRPLLASCKVLLDGFEHKDENTLKLGIDKLQGFASECELIEPIMDSGRREIRELERKQQDEADFDKIMAVLQKALGAAKVAKVNPELLAEAVASLDLLQSKSSWTPSRPLADVDDYQGQTPRTLRSRRCAGTPGSRRNRASPNSFSRSITSPNMFDSLKFDASPDAYKQGARLQYSSILLELEQAYQRLIESEDQAAHEDEDASELEEEVVNDQPSEVQAVQVYFRIRSMIGTNDAGPGPMAGDPKEGLVTLQLPPDAPPDLQRQAKFHHVFDGDTDQQKFFQITTVPVLEKVVEGYNACILAYGQSGTGKSYTMIGRPSPDEQGLIPRSMDFIASKLPENSVVRCAIIEFHKDGPRDLINRSWDVDIHKFDSAAKRSGGNLISDFAGLGFQTLASGPNLAPATSELLQRVRQRRATRARLLNDESHRGHLAVVFEVTADEYTSLLYFLDLAGSEKTKMNGVVREELAEATQINQSLFHLRKMIRDLAQNRKRGRNVEKSTALCTFLKPFIGESAFLHVVCTCSPDSSNMPETLKTVSFAIDAMAVENKPKLSHKCITLEAALAKLTKYAERNRRLKRRVKQFDGQSPKATMDDDVKRCLELALTTYYDLANEDWERPMSPSKCPISPSKDM
eukprot:TRINITY_DN7921_c0_g1_i1.p1 TRINITY_DN7921_c0_g1~~TRINITY_DN7921_c0_g1_i1.p1  ORF type:complete len:1771 (+),score=396.10 TRINITY_DN7921_c0_g1_i1:415-5313(+)